MECGQDAVIVAAQHCTQRNLLFVHGARLENRGEILDPLREFLIKCLDGLLEFGNSVERHESLPGLQRVDSTEHRTSDLVQRDESNEARHQRGLFICHLCATEVLW